MNQIVESLHLPAELQARAARSAALEGLSLEQWILDAVAAKLQAAEFFNRRNRDGSGKSLMEILDAVPANSPLPGDEMPATVRPHD
jgi:hypothetical protein